ncbi:MAG: condensation domain-containing protein [Xanthobacteraceae bacterium]|nr:condensation domain-containing protein [Xanthobacteraceae bacterium]
MSQPLARTAVFNALSKVMKLSPELASRLQDPSSDVQLAELTIDSLDALELCMEIETGTGVELDPAELAPLDTIGDLIRHVAGKDRRAAASIVRASRNRPLPLSLTQERVWSHCQQLPDPSGYILSMIDKIEGPLDVGILATCLSAVISRHEILRTTFPLVDGRPVQTVHPAEEVGLRVVSIDDNEDPELAARRIVEVERSSISDLAGGPLLKFVVLRICDQEHLLIRLAHHMVWDGQSGKLFLDELTSLYEARLREKPTDLPALQLQYADYAVWQRAVFDPDGQAYHRTVAWWETHFRDARCSTELPFKRSKALSGVDPSAGRLVRLIEPKLMERLNELRRGVATTPYKIWLAGFVAVLWLETNCPDLVVGTYVTDRRHRQLRDLVGDFSHTIAIRFSCDGDITFSELVSHVGATVAAAESNSSIPLETLGVELQRRNIEMPPVSAIFSMPPGNHSEERRFANLRLYSAEPRNPTAMPWGFSLQIYERNQEYWCEANFDAGIYDPLLVRKTMDHLCEFLTAVSHHPELEVGELRRG